MVDLVNKTRQSVFGKPSSEYENYDFEVTGENDHLQNSSVEKRYHTLQKFSIHDDTLQHLDTTHTTVVNNTLTSSTSRIENKNEGNKENYPLTEYSATSNDLDNKQTRSSSESVEMSEEEHSDDYSVFIIPSSSNVSSDSSQNSVLIKPVKEISVKIGKNSSFNKKGKRERDLCIFCFKEITHFSRRLLHKHSDEATVKKIIKMPLNSNERRNSIIALRKKGNFILNKGKGSFKPARKPTKIVETDIGAEYFPCESCLGFYKKRYLWRHRRNCKANINNYDKTSKVQHLTESQTFLATTGLLGNFLNKSRLKTEVLNIMRPDRVSFVAKSDPLICLYGESYLNKHKRKQMNVVVSNKMRELARLKIAMQNAIAFSKFFGILKPEMYNNFIAASKIISGYNNEQKTFKASSLAYSYI